MNPSPHQIIGVMILALCVVGLIVTIDYGYRLGWLTRARAWLRGLLDGWAGDDPWTGDVQLGGDDWPELADDDGRDIADLFDGEPAVWQTCPYGICTDLCPDTDCACDCVLHQADVYETQPFQAFRDPPAGSPVLVPVQGDWVPVTYEPPIPPDVLGPGAGTGGAAHPPAPEYAPFQPHAGPPAWQPRHAKTSWVDELIADCLGAPSVEVYMWNWQQRHRLAVTA